MTKQTLSVNPAVSDVWERALGELAGKLPDGLSARVANVLRNDPVEAPSLIAAVREHVAKEARDGN